MIDKKNTGAYYTPLYLANFITRRVMRNLHGKKMKILEPSVGDGAFVDSIKDYENIFEINLTALDINESELKKASLKWRNSGNFLKKDFLDYKSLQKFSAVIGNPPYIKKKLLSEVDLEKIKNIHFDLTLSEQSVNNIWTAFVIRSIELLKKDGVIAFVLPSELLQVKYAKEIREYLIGKLDRIEIFTFNDLMFECKGQDTIVLFGYLKHKEKGQFFANIQEINDLEADNFTLRKNEMMIENDTKWSHHSLSEDDINFLFKLKDKLNKISYYTESKPGIVTAANKFFIINTEIEKKYKLRKYTLPIIQKGMFLKDSVVFNNEDLNYLELNNFPTRFINVKEFDKLSKSLKEYINIGEEEGVNKRYKCTVRSKWYVVPNVSTPPKALFFKRSHLYPRLIKNNTESYVTDSAYKLELKENFNINSLIYSFYNSFTLLFAELEGRYYGGGVLELIPSEFKNLPLPYIEVSINDFNTFVLDFENKNSIDEILYKYNYKILNSTLGITKEEIEKIEKIRLSLVNKRIRKK